MKRLLLNIATFKTGYVICAFSATRLPLLAVPAIAALLVLHLWLTEKWKLELRLILIVGIIGGIVDSALGNLGVMRFAVGESTSVFAPAWLIALWMIFATTLPHALKWLAGRPLLAGAVGFVGGPLSYYAGSLTGAIDLNEHAMTSLVAIGAAWAVVLPLISWLSTRPEFNAYDVQVAAQPVPD